MPFDILSGETFLPKEESSELTLRMSPSDPVETFLFFLKTHLFIYERENAL